MVDPASTAALIVGLIDGLCLQRAFDPKVMSAKAMCRVAEEALRSYLGASP